ncbi:MAG: hypothetical protein HFACDABA_00963 [Anaerolineales bacterium]|nr:hypothetical protein [Anaerolineales bacterium]
MRVEGKNSLNVESLHGLESGMVNNADTSTIGGEETTNDCLMIFFVNPVQRQERYDA